MYEKEIVIGQFLVHFEYKFKHDELHLVSWQAYQNNLPVDIPCEVTSKYIESKLRIILSHNREEDFTNFQEDVKLGEGDVKYSRMVEK